MYSHTDSDGRKHYESFTASTKEEANMMASKYENTKKRKKTNNITVAEALDGYITAKTHVLSPSTIRAYRNMQAKYYGRIGSKKIKKLTSEDAQLFISQLAVEYAPKTVKNAYALFTASVAFFDPDISFRVSLPTTAKKAMQAPSDEDIRALCRLASDWMLRCIILSAFGSLRRGEISALKYKDIQGDVIYVHSDMVMDENNKWIHKEIPKNQSSVRYVRLSQRAIDLLGTGDPEEYIIKYNPNTISKMFIKLRSRVGIEVRFHDLRHYYATIGAMLHIPDVVLADFGGWRHDSPTMKNTYQGNIKDISDGYSKKMNSYFDGVMDGSMT